MDVKLVLAVLALLFLAATLALPVSAPKADAEAADVSQDANEKKIESEINDLGLEYGRYLQQVVEALEQDKDFARKLENVSQEDIANGAIARELDFVSHSVRSRLDELKRVELDRLRRLARREHELEANGVDDPNDARRWRTLGGDADAAAEHEHVDAANAASFEAKDLQRLIAAATRDLEAIDRKRREDFKQYEMEKQLQAADARANMTAAERAADEQRAAEARAPRQHERVHHPGSRQQLEQVWSEQDRMPREEFDPKVFFAMHDVNGDHFLDPQEVEALLGLEVRKLYSGQNVDQNEMSEEYHRMREHIYREADTNRDGLIARNEFLEFTRRLEFERDDGWKGVNEQQQFTQDELKQYELHRQQLLRQQQQYGAYQAPPPQYYAPPPHHQQQQQQYYQQQPYAQHPPQHAQQLHPQYANPQHPNAIPQQYVNAPQQHPYAPQHVNAPPPQHINAPPPQQHVNAVPQQHVSGGQQQPSANGVPQA